MVLVLVFDRGQIPECNLLLSPSSSSGFDRVSQHRAVQARVHRERSIAVGLWDRDWGLRRFPCLTIIESRPVSAVTTRMSSDAHYAVATVCRSVSLCMRVICPTRQLRYK
jgi:hypothetical protein